jgi:hypothetical protein
MSPARYLPIPSKRGSAPDRDDPVARAARRSHGVVGRGDDRLGQVAAHLAGVDVERGGELDVADVVAAQVHVHQAGRRRVGRRLGVVGQALDEGRGAVADPDQRDTKFLASHGVPSAWRWTSRGARQLCTSGQAIGGSFVPACGIAHQMIKITAPIYSHLRQYSFAK